MLGRVRVGGRMISVPMIAKYRSCILYERFFEDQKFCLILMLNY